MVIGFIGGSKDKEKIQKNMEENSMHQDRTAQNVLRRFCLIKD